MKNFFFFITIIGNISIYAQSFITDTNFHFRTIPNPAFGFGEKLKYVCSYGFINAGEATLEIKNNPVNFNGRECYHIIVSGRTLGMLDWIYNVRDTYQSYLDVNAIAPLWYSRNISEGKYKYYNEFTFLHNKKKVISKSNSEFEIASYLQDIVSVFYYARSNVFKFLQPGDTIKLEALFDNEIFPVRARYLGKENVKTSLGKFRCLKLIPMVMKGRVFLEEEGITVYISDDYNYIPIRVESKIWIGSLFFDLAEYSSLKNDIVKLK